MYQINLDKLEGGNDRHLELTRRKDGQWTFQTTIDSWFNEVELTTRLSTYDELFRLAHVVETLHNRGLRNIHLKALSLLGMRADQEEPRGAIDLLVIARFINSMKFSSVRVLEPHSLGTIVAINGSSPYYIPWLTSIIPMDSYDILISPDAGAYKTNSKRGGIENKMHIPVSKYRGADGTPYTFLPNIESISGSRCLILDDYIDGGRSFVSLAKELKEVGGASKVTLVACHGLFSYGVEDLLRDIDEIWTTDSLSNQAEIYSEDVNIIEAL